MNSLPVGVGTGVGSMPGTDAAEAAAVVNGELDLAHLAELPARGIGADMIGRMATLLVDMPMDAGTWGYRLAARPSNASRRAADFLHADLDAVEELWDTAGFINTGRAFKVQVCGPFTLAATVETANGHKAIRDRGALSDIVESTAEGVIGHVAEVTRRLGADVVVQLDEPLVGAVIDGSVTPLTRMNPIAAVPVADVAESLRHIVDLVGRPTIVHNCGAPRWDLIARLPGVGHSVVLDRAVRTGASSMDVETLDGIGALVDRGDILVAGVVASDRVDRTARAETVATALAGITDRIGLKRKVLSENVMVTPSCGLAGAPPKWARTALGICARAGELLAADPDAL
ncbi:vitamin-B12 independent methionine synthase [Gordonia sp. NPDC003425]